VGPYEVEALFHVVEQMIGSVFVFDADVAAKLLPLQLSQDAGDITDAMAISHSKAG